MSDGKPFRFDLWLKDALSKKGMIQSDLCRDMYFTRACVSSWVNGRRTPPINTMEDILGYFGCHIEIVPNDQR